MNISIPIFGELENIKILTQKIAILVNIFRIFILQTSFEEFHSLLIFAYDCLKGELENVAFAFVAGNQLE
jgi:hypothetical protein